MPTISQNDRVLVTGANGFLAVWVVKSFLDNGYTVIGTVRSEAKGAHLKKIFKEFGDKFQLAIVKDITADGAFDELVKDVDAIAHTASPFHMEGEDPQVWIHPAVNGTLSVLKSALKNGKNVKRVVVTSSCAAVLTAGAEPQTYTEEDWNQASIDEVETKGKDASNMSKYCASKTLAERAAWDFVKDHKSEISWDLTTLNPPYIFGPVLHEISKPEDLNTSAKLMWQATLPTSTMSPKELAAPGGGWVDVRDIAFAHVLALEIEAASGQRFITSAGEWTYQDFLDIASSLSPSPLKRDVPKGVTGAGKEATHIIKYDASKAAKVLNLKYTSAEQSLKDTFEDYAQRGW
ncbi:D-lactaldehyde dehydrogenase [Pterulicium gracile]|uniref:D-lactaldehyde dehydrogenase n=1 Tax=Pterulicium gracile TaxID=1884261 RepID=A0A5C3QHB1_9AGAR|nr:D-lactaldehyde dehydrogenase [Pterula gracilis]